ncbi:hypothetical protein FRC04_004507 [Tulasnella sp. 424]|nr:hypothetical protein FRC04_004507 [Tulasnella sp. 424]KAG8976576.1 hypothetical protein FRC05_003415 [Tulasnella sp. 425]
MILIAQPHTGLPGIEKRLKPTPTITHPLDDRRSSDESTVQHPLLFVRPSPPPYVLPTSSADRSRSAGKRRTSRRVCRAACGIVTAFLFGLSGALICIWLYWDGFVDIVGQRKGVVIDQPPRPDAALGQVLSCEMRWYLSRKNGLPAVETPDEGADPWRDDIELTPKTGLNKFVAQLGLHPTLPDDDGNFGVHRGSGAYYAATMHFDLPSLNFTQDSGSALDSLFLFATGDNTSGVIRIITKEQNETTVDTRIQVDVVSRFWNADALRKDASVCAMRRGRQLGIAFLGKKAIANLRQTLWLDTTITIPVQPGQILDLDSLVSDVPSFRLVVGLEDKVRFRSTRLHSGNAPITIDSLTSEDIEIKTSNFPVKGTLTTRKSANIATENSPLDVDITTNGGEFQDPSVITLATSNNRLDAVVRLASLQPRGLDVKTTTSNGPMNVTIPYAAWGTHLSYKGSTSNADATIRLPYTFAGTIDLAGSKFSGLASQESEDPTGQGYKKRIKSPRPNLYQIWYKSEEDLGFGHVELFIQNGAASGMIPGESKWRPPTDTALP